jgi:lipase chaperone LimK
MRALLAVALLLVPRALGHAPPPRSLAGAEVDRDGVRRLFEHFLSAAGEEPIAAIEERIVAAAPGRAELVRRYLALREAVRAMRVDPAEDLETRLARLHDLRVQHLGAEAAEELFGLEEAEAQVALARRRGEPVPLSPVEHAAILPVATMQRERGLPPAEVHALRAATFGEAGAARLAELDRRRGLLRDQ